MNLWRIPGLRERRSDSQVAQFWAVKRTVAAWKKHPAFSIQHPALSTRLTRIGKRVSQRKNAECWMLNAYFVGFASQARATSIPGGIIEITMMARITKLKLC